MVKEFTKENIELVKRNLKLTPQSRILNITHKDLDGVGTAIVHVNCFKNISFAHTNYNEIDFVLEKIRFDEYDAVIISDVSPVKRGDILKHPKILMLDHHDTALKYHNPDNMVFVHSGESASLLVKKFWEKYFNKSLEHLSELISVIDDHDMWICADPRGKQLNELYAYYWEEKFIKRFKDGEVGFTDKEQEYIKEKERELEEIYENLEIWNFDGIKMCMFSSKAYTNELCDRLLKKGYKVVLNKNPSTLSCSVRTNMKDLHIGNLLQELKFGGGHKDAGGFYEEDLIKFREKIDVIENKLRKEYKEIEGTVLV